ncbi:hypothetical protein AB0H37_38315 [Actinomadura sp. NPDC023710]|uniref:hypothetical protein n=1 Tax=Actinomadura sp. NPDC023710 TaxID=3158219 RepID=UPI0033FFD4BB
MGVFAAAAVVFIALHPFCDLWLQRRDDSIAKEKHGQTIVARGPDTKALTVSQLGRRAAARHALTYTGAQVAAAAIVLRSLGYRIPVTALLAGAVVNGGTHAVIDRRRFLEELAAWTGHTDFLTEGTVLRKLGTKPRPAASGPGTALYELDAALHLLIGLIAAVLTSRLAVREPAGGTALRRGRRPSNILRNRKGHQS